MGSVSDALAAFTLPVFSKREEGVGVTEIKINDGGSASIRLDVDHLPLEQIGIVNKMFSDESAVFSESKNDVGHLSRLN